MDEPKDVSSLVSAEGLDDNTGEWVDAVDRWGDSALPAEGGVPPSAEHPRATHQRVIPPTGPHQAVVVESVLRAGNEGDLAALLERLAETGALDDDESVSALTPPQTPSGVAQPVDSSPAPAIPQPGPRVEDGRASSLFAGIEQDYLCDQRPHAPLPPVPTALLDFDLSSVAAIEQVEPLTLDPTYWERLETALAVQARQADSATAAAELEFSAAHAAEMCGQGSDARQRYLEVLAHRPDDLAALLAVWRLTGTGADPDKLPQVLSPLAATLTRQARSGLCPMLCDLAWISEHGPPAEAQRLLAEQNALRPLLSRAAWACCQGTAEELGLAIHQLTEELGPSADHATLALQLAHQAEAERDHVGAAAGYQRAVEIAPTQLGGWDGLLRVALATQAPQAAEVAVLRSAPHWGSWSAHRLLRRGPWANDAPADDVTALAASLLHGVPEGLRGDPLVVDASRWAYLRQGDAEGAIAALDDGAKSWPDPAERAHALVEASDIACAIGQESRASDLLTRALEDRGDYPPAIAALGHVALRQRDAGLRTRYSELSAAVLEGSPKAAHLLAAWEAEGRGVAASPTRFDQLARILQLDAVNQRVLVLLDRFGEHVITAHARAMAMDQASANCSDAGRSADLAYLAGIHYERSGRFEDALARLRPALQMGGDAEAARAGVARSLAGLGRWADLADLWAASAMAADHDTARLTGWIARAELLLENDEEAHASYEHALAIDPNSQRAIWGLALLETAKEDWAAADALFERLANQRDDDTFATAAGWLRLAMLRERQLHTPEQALVAYGNAAGLGLAVARDGLSRCWSVTGRVVDDLRARLECCTSSAERFALLTAASTKLGRSADTRDQAGDLIEEALGLQANHALGTRQARALRRAQDEGDAPTGVARDSDGDAHLSDDQRRREILAQEQLGEMALRAGRVAQAAAAFEMVLRLDPSSLHALRVLQLLPSAAERDGAQTRLLHREAETTSSAVDGPALWIDLGHLLENDASPSADASAAEVASAAPSAAENAYERAFRLDPRGRLALVHLLKLVGERRDSLGQAAIYQRLASRCDDEVSAAFYFAHAARLRGHDAQLYRAAARSRPTHLSALVPLRLQAERAGDVGLEFEAAAAEARATRVPTRAIALHRQAARAARGQLNDPQAEVEHLWRIVELDAGQQEAFDRLRELLGRQSRWTELATLLQRAIETEPHPSRRSGLHRALAEVATAHEANPGLARKQLGELLALSPSDTDALGKLANIHESEGRWEDLADTLLRQSEAESDPLSLTEILLRLGRICADKLEDKQRARDAFERALRLDPESSTALTRLSQIYIEAQDFDRALSARQRLCDAETDANQLVDHLLFIAKVLEDGLDDKPRAAQSFRRAVESAPADLKAIGALCGFHARQGDQRSVAIHLDTALSTMRERLLHDPFEPFAAHALFKIFGWRRNPDGALCAAQLLDAIGEASPDEVAFIDAQRAQMGRAAESLADDAHDDLIFANVLPRGFRHVFRLLADPLSRSHKAELRKHGVARADRLVNPHHPLRGIGDSLAAEFGVDAYDLYLVEQEPLALIVENTDPPSVIVGSRLVQNATEDEVHFLLGRCLWLIRKAMVLPARLVPRDLEVLVAAVIRQYRPDFAVPGADEEAIQRAARQVAKASRKLRQTLMPFALECAGSEFDAHGWGAAVIHSANRAGLLACGSTRAALDALCRASGQDPDANDVSTDNPEAEHLLRFSVSKEYLQLRRDLGIAVE